jgi:hypothetical protein
MLPPNVAPTFVDDIRELVPIVTGIVPHALHYRCAPLPMDIAMMDGPPASRNANTVHSWLQDSVATQRQLLDKIVDFFVSGFVGAHSAFWLMITCAVRRYGFMLRTLPPYVCHMYLATADSAVFRIIGVFPEIRVIKSIKPRVNCLSLRSLGDQRAVA